MTSPPWNLLVFRESFLRASNRVFLDICGSQSDSSELLLVTPLAFSDLALAHLGGALFILGGSGVEVLLICILHWSLFAAEVLCWLSKLLVTAIPCCSLCGLHHASSCELLPFQGGQAQRPCCKIA